MMPEEKILGVVLCGGESIRMGEDKGLISLGKKRWVEVIKEKFDPLLIPSVVSINTNQVENYQHYFGQEELIIDDPSLKIRGPLRGLLSVHLKFPEKDLIVLACDMIQMNSIVLEELLNESRKSGTDAITFKGENIEPLCAFYSSKGLEKIYQAYKNGSLQKYSMIHALQILKTTFLSIKGEWTPFFKNLNSPDDLAI